MRRLLASGNRARLIRRTAFAALLLVSPVQADDDARAAGARPGATVGPEADIGARLARDGEVRVIVALRDGGPVTARDARRAGEMAALRRRQDDVLGALPAGAFRLRTSTPREPTTPRR